jgi:Fe-S cluster assembly protein SufB
MNETKQHQNLEIRQVINQPYKYGFQTKIESETFPCGINEEVIRKISSKKVEPEFLLEFRLKAYKKWKTLKFPNWANLEINPINYDSITYYSVPKQKQKLNSLEEIDPEILKTFQKFLTWFLTFT